MAFDQRTVVRETSLAVRINRRPPAAHSSAFAAACEGDLSRRFQQRLNANASRGPLQRERTAHRVAWAAVKHSYQEVGDRWIARESG
ncbi:ChaB family protein [Bradyrhizobium sp. AUGA SZCCT0283]|uniref:ChaB family protein n=1 Tax=Bradyrhizobium sp. AUGA SZCCT0283 TaxID=2807671 RepID=UPI00390809A1